jgi:hypothetical protein
MVYGNITHKCMHGLEVIPVPCELNTQIVSQYSALAQGSVHYFLRSVVTSFTLLAASVTGRVDTYPAQATVWIDTDTDMRDLAGSVFDLGRITIKDMLRVSSHAAAGYQREPLYLLTLVPSRGIETCALNLNRLGIVSWINEECQERMR